MNSDNPPHQEQVLNGSLTRRRCLQLTAAVGGLAAAGSASAATERRGISFDQTVNIVDDYGADPTGNQAVDDALEEAATDGTLVVFPEGTYQFADTVKLTGIPTIGILGDGDVSFVPPNGFNKRLLNIGWNVDNALIEGIEVDLTGDETTTGFRTQVSDRAVLQSIQFTGRGYHPDSDVVTALHVESTDTDAMTIIRDVDLPNDGKIKGFKGGNGRTAVYAGSRMKGTLRIENSYFAQFGSNAIYASKTPGNVEVENCRFKNNNVASVRISGKGSYAKNCVIDLDVSDYDGETGGRGYNLRGIWLEQGPYDYPSGALIRDCDLHVKQTDGSAGGIVVDSSAKEATIIDTNVHVEEDGTVGIHRLSPDKSPNALVANGVSVTGNASGAAGIYIKGTTGSEVKKSCISQPNRDGVHFTHANDASVNRSTINVSNQNVVEENCSVTIWEIDGSGSCPLPSNVGSSSLYDDLEIRGIGGRTEYRIEVDKEIDAAGNLESGDWAGDTTAAGSVYDGGADFYKYKWDLTDITVTSGSTHDIRVFADGQERFLNRLEVTADVETEYRIEVSGGVTKWGKANINDSADDGVAEGVVNGGIDSYGFSGDVTDVTVTNGSRSDLEVSVNGEPYAERLLEIECTGDKVAYNAKVTGNIFEGPRAGSGDTTGDGYAKGAVWPGYADSYRFYGWLGGVEATEGSRSDIEVYVDGERPWKNLEIQGNNWAEYEIEVTGEITPGSKAGEGDSANGTTASGSVGEGYADSYRFTGNLADVTVTSGPDSDVTVLVNGTERSI